MQNLPAAWLGQLYPVCIVLAQINIVELFRDYVVMPSWCFSLIVVSFAHLHTSQYGAISMADYIVIAIFV